MLELKNLTIGYENHTVLSDVCLQLTGKRIVGIRGRNGSGKSTLLKSLVGLSRLFNGKIVFDNQDITELPTYKIIQKGITYISQDRGLFPDLTIDEHFKVISSKKPKEKMAGIFSEYEWIKEMKNRKVSALSGGQQRMISILLLHLADSRVIILDEPTAGLDAASIKKVEELVIKLKDEHTILIAEQNERFLESIADEIFEINEDGRLIKQSGKIQD